MDLDIVRALTLVFTVLIGRGSVSKADAIGNSIAVKPTNFPKLTRAYAFSEESMLRNDSAYKNRIDHVWTKNNERGGGDKEMELKDFAEGSSESGLDETILPTQLKESESLKPSATSENRPYNLAEAKQLQQDVSYINYVTEVLGKKPSFKFKRNKENAAALVPQTITEEEYEGEESNPRTAALEAFQAYSQLPASTNVSVTFENQLEDPNMAESPTANKVDSEDDEFFSLSAESTSQESMTKNVAKIEVKEPVVAAPIIEKDTNVETETKFLVSPTAPEKEKTSEDKKIVIENTPPKEPEKQTHPRLLKLEIPEHLAKDPDRILDAVDLERSYISRHFGFYNPEPGNRQSITNFINTLSRESKGYEIRTARISKRLFKALNDIQKKSFCEEHINGNVILGSRNLIYDESADVQDIVAVRKTVVYRWKLPSEKITTVRCPLKARKREENTPSVVYVVPVVYDDEYKSSYTFIFTDCAPEDACGPDEAKRAVRLYALSRVDLDYVIERIKAKLENIRTDEMKPKAQEPADTKKQPAEATGNKSLFQPEERATLPEKPVPVNTLIEKYLQNPTNVKVLTQLRQFLSTDELVALQRKAQDLRQQGQQKNKKKKKEPWLVKIVKHFTGIGKKDKNAPKADFYVDKAFTVAKAPLLQVS